MRQAQADLAREHGVHRFCYYHYWMDGRRMLQRPLEEVLGTGHPDFPFCLCWANHAWSWKRDQSFQGRLVEQDYSEEDDREHIRWLLGVFADRRYTRVNGRPLVLIYWTDYLPDPARTFEVWREEASRAGEAEPYIVKIDAFGRGKAYSSAAIVLNDHRDDAGEQGVVSGRIYDALSCDALVFSVHLPELEERFGDAIVTYRTPEELRSLIEHYLNSPEERVERGQRGREKVLASHTFEQRADLILREVVRQAEEIGFQTRIRPGATIMRTV